MRYTAEISHKKEAKIDYSVYDNIAILSNLINEQSNEIEKTKTERNRFLKQLDNL